VNKTEVSRRLGLGASASGRGEWLWRLGALLGVAFMAWAGLQGRLRGFVHSDYGLEAAAAYKALSHGDIGGFLGQVPAYGGSLVLRAPFAWVASALGGGELAVYRAVSIPCLLAFAFVALVVVRRMGACGRPTKERALVLGLCVANPVTLRALYMGHPEEMLCAAFAIGAVLAAADRRTLWAAVLLGLAIATKAWAVLAIGPVLIALPSRRLVALGVAGAVTAAVLAPIALFAPHAAGLVSAASHTDEIFNPWQLFWWLGEPDHLFRDLQTGATLTGYRVAPNWLLPLTHPLIALLVVPLSLMWARVRGAAPRINGEHALGLLALLFLLRCALDPWNNVYYELPFLLALLAWEALCRPNREPLLAFCATALVWVSFEVVPNYVSPDLQSAFFLAWSLPFAVWLARELFAPPRRVPETEHVIATAGPSGFGMLRASRTTVVSDPARGTAVCERCVVADRTLSRMRGLLGRADLAADEGLLLAPAGSIHTHFMRFPIDAVFLDRDSRVVALRKAIGPWRMARARGAKAVLELRAGEAQQRGIALGDELRAAPEKEARHA
jgi:uncharacterized membrane protein (UPF0127 family)